MSSSRTAVLVATAFSMGGVDAACTQPASTTGYSVTEDDLDMDSNFSVTVSCATNYHILSGGNPTATVCATDNTPYTLSGCGADTCVTPTSGVGRYDLSGEAGTLTIDGFNPTGLACVTSASITGSVSATACTGHNLAYGVSGCIELDCVRPADITGYDFSSATENLDHDGFGVTGLACATGYTGTPSAAACSTDNGEYTLSGCTAPAAAGNSFAGVSAGSQLAVLLGFVSAVLAL